MQRTETSSGDARSAGLLRRLAPAGLVGLAVLALQLQGASGAAAAGSWSAPQTLAANVEDFFPPQLAENSNGDAVMSWTDAGGIETSRRAAGEPFASFVNVSTDGSNPSIGIDSQGNATLVFSAGDADVDATGNVGVVSGWPAYVRSAATGGWGPAYGMVKDGGGATTVTVGAGGGTVGLMHGAATVGFGVSDSWTDEDWALGPFLSAAAQDDGSALLVLNASDEGAIDYSTLQVAQLDAYSEATGPPVTVAQVSGATLEAPQIAVTAAGDAYLAYVVEDGDYYALDVVIRHDGSWSAPATITSSLDPYTTDDGFVLSIDHASGAALLAYAQQEADSVSLRVTGDASPADEFTPISTPLTTDLEGDFTLSMSGSDTGAAAWIDASGALEAATMEGGAFGTPVQVSTVAHYASRPSLGGAGAPTLVWLDDPGDGVYSLEASTFTAAGSSPPPTGGTPPSCAATSATLRHDTSVRVGLPCTVSSGGTATITIVTPPAHGTLGAVDQGTASVVYTPAPGYHGSDSFTYEVSDGSSTSAPQTASLSITYQAPSCLGAQVYEQYTDLPVALRVAAACTNPEAWPLSWQVVSQPAKGTLSATNASAGWFTFTPPTGFDGDATMTLRATAADGESWDVKVSIEFDLSIWSDGVTVTSGGCLGAEGASLVGCALKFACPTGPDTCTYDGDITNNLGGAARAKPKAKPKPLARRFHVRVAPGKHVRVRVRLTRAGIAALKRRRKLVLYAHITVSTHGARVHVTRKLVVRLRRVKKHRHA